MGIPNHLEARLARLEARVAAIPDPQAERERERLSLLHLDTWLDGGSLEDIPEEDRDPQVWELQTTLLSVQLQMYQEGSVPVPEEFLEAGIDFTQVDCSDEDDVRAFFRPFLRIPDPNAPDEP